MPSHDSPNPPPPETLGQYPTPPVSHETQAPIPEKPHSGTEKGFSAGEEEPSSRRPLRSRWDADTSEPTCSDSAGGGRKRRSRWADDAPTPVIQLPDFMKDFAADLDPEVQSLNFRLVEISRTLQSGLPLDGRPELARSPSPEPFYDNMGVRMNTREYRARGKLLHERQTIICKLIQKNPAFRPPADYRPPKLHRKLYIPMKEFPGYNFIGLIIGPRGNTQKRMERETGAKIVIRGKGSVKEGRLHQKRDSKHDLAENEDLHVLVEAETQAALDKAADMVERLLQPVDEVLNEHKRQQLRELASLNGTTRDEEFCSLCGEQGHRQYACPARSSSFKSDVLCKICGDGGHPTIDCPVKGSVIGNKMDDEYQNFLAELGGSAPESLTKQTLTFAIQGSNSECNPSWVSGGGGVGITDANGKEYDETNLYVGYLPPTLDDDGLIRLFISFGDVVMAKVIKDKITGLSKGYGFVKYSDVSMANRAISSMNGYNMEGRTIAVRVAGKPLQTVVPPGPSAPVHALTYPPSYSLQQSYMTGNARPVGAPVPLGSPVPPPYASYPPPPPGSTMYPIPPPRSTMYSPHPPGFSDANHNTPPGVSTSMYGPSYNVSGAGMVPPVYTSSSYGYPPYFFPASTLPPPTFHPSQSVGNVPSASNQLASRSTVPWAFENPSQSEGVTDLPWFNPHSSQPSPYAADTEYEKFVSEKQ